MMQGNVAMRASPIKTSIILKESTLLAHGLLTKEKAGDIASHGTGMSTDEGDVLVDQYGRPLVDRHVAYLPDPRYNERAHAVFATLWYGGALSAVLYIIWVFLTYQPEQYTNLPFTTSLDPKVRFRIRASCTGPTTMTVRVNYSLPSSRCYNESATVLQTTVNLPRTRDMVHMHALAESRTRRAVFQPLEETNFSITNFPPPIRWRTADVPVMPRTTEVEFNLCVAPQDEYNSNDYWPNLGGVAIMFTNISSIELCTIDVFPQIASSDVPVKRLNVEGGVVKTFFLQYIEERVRVKNEMQGLSADEFLKESVTPNFYELDGMRHPSFGGDSSIIKFQYTDISLSIVHFDMRTWIKAGGMFGSLWYLISNYFCFYAAPLLLYYLPRDFEADMKNGKLDGYTLNMLAHCWRPTVWLWIVGDLTTRITAATGGK